MSSLLAGLVSMLVATNQSVAVSNYVVQTTGISVNIPDANDPIEKRYQEILKEDDKAQAEVDGWIRENMAFKEKGGGAPDDILTERIMKRLNVVKKDYEDFIKEHPGHSRAMLAYGSFLSDIKDEEGAEAQWEKARLVDPNNAASWNNLANLYGHHGPVKKAFEYYDKAISLSPTEALYYQNAATTTYLFRKDAMEYYNISEAQVFDRAMDLYFKAEKFDPDNFLLAQEVAQSYYGIRPYRTEDALKAWTNAWRLADTDIEREGVNIHFARWKLSAGRFNEARTHLVGVTNEMYLELKGRVSRNIDKQEADAKGQGTNSPPVAVPQKN